MNSLDKMISLCRLKKATDLHFSAGHPPICRINGDLIRIERLGDVSNETIKQLIDDSIPAEKVAEFEEHKQIDYAYQTEDGIRLRCNAFHQQGNFALAIRILNNGLCTIDSLGLPEVIEQICKYNSGLVLVTGPTGSGKSTTLAAMIDYVNESRACHILTIEDPVEYTHASKKALVNQREVGADTISYAEALRGALRQDPDVILIGEMRDLESIAIAVTAAETGHLVFGTLHTLGAAQTIDRLVDVFPPHQQQQIRVQLSGALKAVISQKLVVRADQSGRVAIHEIMLINDAIANHIREGQTAAINNAIQTGHKNGMITFEHSLSKYVKQEIITKETALEVANDVDTLLSMLSR